MTRGPYALNGNKIRKKPKIPAGELVTGIVETHIPHKNQNQIP